MIRTLLASIIVCAAMVPRAHASAALPTRDAPFREMAVVTFHAPDLASSQLVAIESTLAKSLAAVETDSRGRMRVATVRALAKAAPVRQWSPIAGGFVTRID